jgi:metal-responsive CopG/Arc/MetJ family transcriptional regulator
MTSNRNGLEILSFSLTRDLVARLDALSSEIGYQTRSELIRDGVRLLLKKHEILEGMKGTAEGVIILIYDHDAETKVSALRHNFTDVIRSYTHCDFHVRSDRCCEILVFRGKAPRVHKVIDGLQAIKNVDEVQVFLA